MSHFILLTCYDDVEYFVPRLHWCVCMLNYTCVYHVSKFKLIGKHRMESKSTW